MTTHPFVSFLSSFPLSDLSSGTKRGADERRKRGIAWVGGRGHAYRSTVAVMIRSARM